jgi:hypothetical protein
VRRRRAPHGRAAEALAEAVVGLFGDNLVYRADLEVGIAEGLLAPFAYFSP